MIVQNHGSFSLPRPVVRKIARRMKGRDYGAFLVVADGGNYEIYDVPLVTNHHSVLIDPPQEQPEVRIVTEQRQGPGRATYFVIAITALGVVIIIAWKMGFFSWLGSWIQSGLEWAARGLEWIGQQIINGFAWIGKQIAGFFSWVGQQLSNAWSGFVSWVTSGIDWLVDTIKSGVSWIVNQVTTFFSNIGSAISGFFTSIGKDIYNGIMTFVNDIINFFSSIGSAIKGFFSWVVSGITSAINNIVNYFTSAWNNLQSWINEYVVKPIVSSWSWAQQQMSNLWSSIQSFGQQVQSCLSNPLQCMMSIIPYTSPITQLVTPTPTPTTTQTYGGGGTTISRMLIR